MSARIDVQDVSISFGGLKAVQHCTLSVAAGSITGLIGPNGAGKTSLLRGALGLLPHDGTSSLAAISGQARGEHYAATKGGLISMIKAVAVEYARYGVTAHTILPGWIETDMTEGAPGNPKFVDAVSRRIPVRRWGQPADFAAIAVYIMSTASQYHTAETFLIDGGYAVF